MEVESVLLRHAAVAEAAVVGVKDADDLIKPKAFVVLRPGNDPSEALENELKDFSREQLAPERYKYPRTISFERRFEDYLDAAFCVRAAAPLRACRCRLLCHFSEQASRVD